MAEFDRAEYRRLRNFWGLALMAAWLVWWWFSNSAQEEAALAALPPSDGLRSGVSNAWEAAAIRSGFYWRMLVAVLTSPLTFVVSHYFARWRLNARGHAQTARAEAARRAHQAEQEAQFARLRQASETDAEQARRSNDRHELISRIGDVDAQLLVYETEPDAERRTRILLNLNQFVYEIHAKFPGERLNGLLAADPGLLKMVENTSRHMRALGLHEKNFYAVLGGFLPQTDTSSTEPLRIGANRGS